MATALSEFVRKRKMNQAPHDQNQDILGLFDGIADNVTQNQTPSAPSAHGVCQICNQLIPEPCVQRPVVWSESDSQFLYTDTVPYTRASEAFCALAEHTLACAKSRYGGAWWDGRYFCEHQVFGARRCQTESTRRTLTDHNFRAHMKNEKHHPHGKHFSCGMCFKPFVNLSSLKKHFKPAHGTISVSPADTQVQPPGNPFLDPTIMSALDQQILDSQMLELLSGNYNALSNMPISSAPLMTQSLFLNGKQFLADQLALQPTIFDTNMLDDLTQPIAPAPIHQYPTPESGTSSVASPDQSVAGVATLTDKPRKRPALSPADDTARSLQANYISSPPPPPLPPRTPLTIWGGGIAHREWLESIARHCTAVWHSGKRWRRLWSRLSATTEELSKRIEKCGGIDQAPMGTRFLFADLGRLLHDVDEHLGALQSAGLLSSTLTDSEGLLVTFSRRLRTMHSDLRLTENWWNSSDDTADEKEDLEALRKYLEGLNPYDKYTKEIRTRIAVRLAKLDNLMVIDG
ncbi:hypothetical protein M427DRAFT_131791 [Gonapodya prolifera JEL478]|uniref:C2H2-type domain-containing protein n=1 Tax=Gonapodya prolifera (strain JEL478) TaxID=1344416 RepID=A0A139ASW9_GONPJ|nr:hypothetical protein M427DRAFT_131791 [Gonapodya prolifera JEL478]|eukprot:KXS19831.1 hypothetical protein M427DRAFT_131791 [Gonapodya prolifera JEL478]